MNVFDFIKETTTDHRLIKSIAKGTIALKSQRLSNGYKLYMTLNEAEDESMITPEEARTFLGDDFNLKAFTLKDSISSQLGLYEKFKEDAPLYFQLTHFISNFFNLTPIGLFNRNLDRLDEFKFLHEDLTLETLLNTNYRVMGALCPTNPEYRFYATMPIVSEIFSGCQTPFEVLALANRVMKDTHILHVKSIKKGNAKFEWYLPDSEGERRKLLKRKSTVDIGVGEYLSLKDIIIKFGKSAPQHFSTPIYTTDVLNSLSELMT